jgi:hypothetical protein
VRGIDGGQSLERETEWERYKEKERERERYLSAVIYVPVHFRAVTLTRRIRREH